MRLTRRGKAIAGVAALAFALAGLYGARSLNAVFVPVVVALVAAVLQVRSLARPDVSREVPADGFPGDTGTVTLDFEADDPFVATVVDGLPPGLDGDPTVETTVGTDPVSYEVTYRARGEQVLGPVTLVARDLLGLVETRLTCPARDRLLVYPDVRALSPGARRDLQALYDPGVSDERDEFDRLREYDRGDALRDIHWKTSAKRDDLTVVEFMAEGRSDPVAVSAGAASGAADAMARAAASVGLALLRAGIPVQLSTPTGSLDVDPGDHEPLLEHLARTDVGAVPNRDADVRIHAEGSGTRVFVGGIETTFDRMVDADPGRPGRTARPTDGSADRGSGTDSGSGSDPDSDADDRTAEGVAT